MKKTREVALITVATLAIIVAGCAKKKVAAAPPQIPQPTQTNTASNTPSTPAPRNNTADSTPSTPAPKPSYPDAVTRARIDQLLAKIEDAYFDYDQHTLRPDAINALKSDSTELRDILKDYPNYKLTIEGHADERGSAEYNMQLGQARAESAKNYLSQVGIPGDQLSVVSYGKERPACMDHEESCWQKNRRIHIVALAQ